MLSFNEWLLKTYGITSDDMTDDDYDGYYEQYLEYKSWDSKMEGMEI